MVKIKRVRVKRKAAGKKKNGKYGTLTQAQLAGLGITPQNSATSVRTGASGPQISKSSKSAGGKAKIVQDVCSLTNPFCDRAFGTKWPDLDGAITIPFTYHYVINVTSVAAQSTMFALMADWLNGFQNFVAVAGTFTFPNWNNHGGTSVATTYGVSGRVVSSGFIGRVTSNATNTQGYVILRESTQLFPTGTLPASTIPSGPNSKVIPLSPGVEFSFQNRPLGPGARDYHAPLAVTVDGFQSDWTIGMCEIITGVATTTISFEVFVHCEIQLGLNNALYAVTQPTQSSPKLAEAAAKVHQNVEVTQMSRAGNLSESLDKHVQTIASKVIDSFFADPLGWGMAAFAALGI
jgi:hypothetical protein